MGGSSPCLDLFLPLVSLAGDGQGALVPADHGYALYSALSRIVPRIHDDARIALHPLKGRPAGNRRIALARSAALGIRVPADSIPVLLPLAGQVLDLDGARVQVGVPTVHALRPAARLVSRMVTVKGMMTPGTLLQAAHQQCHEKGIVASLSIPMRRATAAFEGGAGGGSRDPFLRRTLQVGAQTIVGYAMVAWGLSAEDSIRLQEAGIGGRRHFGCGVFVPAR